VYRGLLYEGQNLSRGSDEAGGDRRVKTEEEYRKLLANINNVITDQAQTVTGDRIALRDAVCAYLEAEQARGTPRARVIQILEEILRNAEQREPRTSDAGANLSGELASQLVAWCVESQGSGDNFPV